MDKHQIDNQLQQLSDNFYHHLPNRIEELNRLWVACREDGWQTSIAKQLHFQAHSLAGSCGTFGAKYLSQLSQDLEASLANFINEHVPDEKQQSAIQETLIKITQHQPQSDAAHVAHHHAIDTMTPLGACPIYVVDDNIELAESMAIQLRALDYEVVCFPTLQAVSEAIKITMPGAIVMDMMFPEGKLAGADLIDAIREQYLRDIPIIFMSVQEDLSARLRAVQCGGKAYFVKPFDVSELGKCLDELVAKRQTSPYRVTIVDDDVYLTSHYARLLKSADIQTELVHNPLTIMDAITEQQPDLILLDLHMPQCNGLQLAEVLRQHESFQHIPIIFLSAEENIQKHFQARMAGADDYLQKPIEDDHLIATVVNRCQRARSLKAKITHDGMTGLFTHISFEEELQRHMALHQRSNTSLCMCMCDLDFFKQINDRHGHQTGDMIIKRFANLLKTRLRCSDIIGRYGGEEFSIILAETEPADAISLMNSLREDFSAMQHCSNADNFVVTTSIGISTIQATDYEIYDLIKRADNGLYQAKAQGRNQVVFVH